MRRHRVALLVGVALLALAGVGVGCLATASRSIEVARLRGPYRVEVHAEGRLAEQWALVAGSPAERSVTAWLATHPDGWSSSLVTHAPGRVVRGKTFNLNLLPDGQCVLNYGSADGPRQVTRQVSAAEADELVAATRPE